MLGNLFHFQLKKENQDLKGDGASKLSKADKKKAEEVKKKAEKERKEREKEEKNKVSVSEWVGHQWLF